MERTLLRITILRESNSNTSNRIRIFRGKRRPSRRKSVRTTPSISPSTSKRRRSTALTKQIQEGSTASILSKIRVRNDAIRIRYTTRRNGCFRRRSKHLIRGEESLKVLHRKRRRRVRFSRERKGIRGIISPVKGIGRLEALEDWKRIFIRKCDNDKKQGKPT